MTRRGLILFGSLGVAWGIPYLFIKIAVGELAPEVVALSRSALAAVLLLPIAAFRHEIAPVLRRWRPMLVYTVVEMVIPWYLLSSAETRLPSSTTGLLIAAVPLAGIAVAWALGKPTQFRGWNWLGIAVGMAGVGALVGFDVNGSNLSAVAEVAVVVVGYALGPAILAHWVPELPGVGVTAVSLAAVAVIYTPVVALRGSWPTAWPSGGVVTSIVVLAVVCSALAFVMMIALINEYGIRWIVNNQYGWKSGGATHRPAAYACKSTSIGSCDDVIRMDTTQRLEIGPISYVLLTSSGG